MAQAKKTTKSKSTSKASAKKPAAKKSAAASKKPKSEPVQKPADPINYSGRIAGAFACFLLAVCFFVSYSFDVGLIKESGIAISGISDFFKGVIGWGYWIVGFSLVFIAIFLIPTPSHRKYTGIHVACLLILPLLFSAIIGIFTYEKMNLTAAEQVNYLFEGGKNFETAGVLPGLLVNTLASLLSKYGAAIIFIVLGIVCLIFSLGDIDAMFAPREEKEPVFAEAQAPIRTKLEKPAPRMISLSEIQANTPRTKKKQQTPQMIYSEPSNYDIPLGEDTAATVRGSSRTRKSANPPSLEHEPAPKKQERPAVKEAELQPASGGSGKARKPSKTVNVPALDDDFDKDAGQLDDLSPIDTGKPEIITKEEIAREVQAVANEIEAGKATEAETEKKEYVFPDINLLKYGKNSGKDSSSLVYETQVRLENALHSFGINSEIINIIQGPTVTRYDIELEQGVKLTKVTNLSDDLALALGARNVRVAPIPDEISTVGIEVPNKANSIVSLREIIESEAFQKATSKLSFAIGKDIGGNAIVGNISKLPHLLIAGTTGSGKSVCMNSLIISLLYKAKPDEVKFIMVDPKMVELGIYNSIPHLYVPVVTDPKKAAGALQWAVVEMLKRYRIFSDATVKDLEGYNSIKRKNHEETLPQVVIVIDELADLMMAASKEVEESICRIAQMGRAAGMHLIIATQRPSADVITGLMKANIPSRIAFAVSSAMESRIILDQSGAEKLIGNGDMLFAPLGIGKPIRIQGAFVSDAERDNLIRFMSRNCDCSRADNEELDKFMNDAVSTNESTSNAKADKGPQSDYDDMLPDAVSVVLEMKQCSVSMLQRRLKLGYSRAARIVDQMEKLGIVGPYEGAKPRSVLTTREGWQTVAKELGYEIEDEFTDIVEEFTEEDGGDELL